MKLDSVAGINAVGIDLGERTVTVAHETDPDIVEAALRSLDLGTTRLEDQALSEPVDGTDPGRERSALRFAFAINAAFFVAELTTGLISRSMGLIADSVDMGADASVYALSLAAVGGSLARKKQLASFSAYLQFGLAGAGLLEVLRRLATTSAAPDVSTMIVMSLLALGGNVVTLVILHRVKSGEVHIQASWIFTANDIKVNALVILAAIAVAVTESSIPDLVAGALIFVVVARGARRILAISR